MDEIVYNTSAISDARITNSPDISVRIFLNTDCLTLQCTDRMGYDYHRESLTTPLAAEFVRSKPHGEHRYSERPWSDHRTPERQPRDHPH